MKNDKYFLKKAIEVGNKVAKPYNFGAVVVKKGKIIAADHNHVHDNHNPSLHSEVCAIVSACKQQKTHNLDNCTLYASHEPCLMCVNLAAWAHIERIVYASPAKESQDFVYHFEDLPIEEFVKKLPRPMKVELIRISDEKI